MTTANSGLPAPATTRGILYFCIGMALFSCLDATAKTLSHDLPVLQVIWLRYVAHFLLAALVLNPWTTPDAYRTSHPGRQLWRGLFLFGATLCNFTAITHLQLAEAASIMFASPLLIAILAVPMLGEKIGPRRWGAIGIGFIGVLVVMRPGLGGLSWAALYSVAAVICASFYAVTTRQLAGRDSAASLLIISAGVGVIALAPAMPAVWVWPSDPWDWALIVLMGVFGAVGHWFWILAHRLAPAPILAPFVYSGIVWMIGLGYLLFGDTPTIWTLLGAGIVILSGLYLLARERKVKDAPHLTDTAAPVKNATMD